jgi:2-iminobutanoate/2-iminopropanoate deaminase
MAGEKVPPAPAGDKPKRDWLQSPQAGAGAARKETGMTRQTVASDRAPKAIGPYSHGVWAGDLLFLSGQTPIDPATGALVQGDITVQTRRVFDNLEAVLAAAGLSMDDVVKCTVFLASFGDFAAMNAVYQTRFAAPFPARSTVAAAGLPLGALVEIEMVAKKPR